MDGAGKLAAHFSLPLTVDLDQVLVSLRISPSSTILPPRHSAKDYCQPTDPVEEAKGGRRKERAKAPDTIRI